MSQEIDYRKVLADLEAKKAAIETSIAGIKQMLGQEVLPGTFHGLSMAEAAKKYLRMVKVKKKTKEICDALLKGGVETIAKDFYSNMFNVMQRNKDFIKLGVYWGLSEWHGSAEDSR